MSDEIKDADGLYYPYINIRDDTWLKTSLPYFPHVMRMVPAITKLAQVGLMRTLATTRSSVPIPYVEEILCRQCNTRGDFGLAYARSDAPPPVEALEVSGRYYW